MGARAMWNANLAVDAHAIPVKLYAAIEDRTVHFRLLDSASLAPVEQQLIDVARDAPIHAASAQKAANLDHGTFVVLTPDELAALAPAESRTITVERFVPPHALDAAWYERPYWLAPDGNLGAYFALVAALAAEARVGIAHWVMRGHRYVGALRVSGAYLMLIRLRHTEEVVPASVLRAPVGRGADSKEIALAEQLVAALEGPFEPSELGGRYEDRVRELVEAKAAGKVVKLPHPRTKKATQGSLADALKASLKRIGGRHG
jgi:DNA end-binding protein Ku